MKNKLSGLSATEGEQELYLHKCATRPLYVCTFSWVIPHTQKLFVFLLSWGVAVENIPFFSFYNIVGGEWRGDSLALCSD